MADSSPTTQFAASDSFSSLNGNHDFLGPYFSQDHASLDLPRQDRSPSATPLSVMSDHSSSSAMYQSALSSQPNLAPAPRKLRSQYPPDPNKSHVEFILVASFDIDRGSILEHQYPGSISGDEHMLAELMLPDQAHNRTQDWTIFFLHKDPSPSDDDEETQQQEARSEARRRRQRRRENGHDRPHESATSFEFRDQYQDAFDDSDLGSSEEDEGNAAAEGPPLIYVLNLVVTKHDSSVKRGAIVKAMAICTRHPFLHIYKPLLLLAMDEYFKSSRYETLAALYEAVNSMDLSLMPRLSLLERNILQASTSKDLFREKFQRMIDQRKAEDAQLGIDSPIKATGSSQDNSAPPVSRYTLPRDTHEFESRILYNGISVPVKIPTARSPETVGDFSLIKLIQTFSTPHSQSPQAFTQHPHLTTGGAYTHPIVVLVNALLTQKRIIFLGHNMPSGEVAEAVLASCALASGGMLRGFTRHAFPYTDLTKIDDLLKVPGFIAGVTNPAFANKPEWWDLLCDLPSGRMKISNLVEVSQPTEGIQSFQQQNPTMLTQSNLLNLQNQDATGDAAFMEAVLRNMTNRLGEGVIRSMWRDWIIKLIRLAADFEELVYGASALYIGGEEANAGAFGIKGHGYVWPDDVTRARETAANVHRIEGWRNTRSYYSLIQDLANLYKSRPISSIDLNYQHDRLRSQKLTKDDSAAIYLAFSDAIHSNSEICQLLTVTPESHGGLFYLSLGLVHPRLDARYKTVELLDRIRTHEAGRHFWEALGRFAKLAFFRLKREKDLSERGEGGSGDSGRAMDIDEGAEDIGSAIGTPPNEMAAMGKTTAMMEQTSVGS